MNGLTGELYDLIEQSVRDELYIRPNQDINSIAHAVAREVIRRLDEHQLKVVDSRPFFIYDTEENGCSK